MKRQEGYQGFYPCYSGKNKVDLPAIILFSFFNYSAYLGNGMTLKINVCYSYTYSSPYS